MPMRRFFSGLMPLLLLAIAHPASAQDAVAQFYKGKQIKLYIASTPGGGYDSYGRLLGQYIGKYIPGNPTIVPQNMPGADRKSTRLNSSHPSISYAVFCLKKKKKNK